MAASKNQKTSSPTGPNIGRHASGCRICAHPQRREIEDDFIQWRSPAEIAREFGLRDRSSVYRHAHAFDLFQKRTRNLRAALERIIERVDETPVTAGAVIQAVNAYVRINAHGELIERSPVGLNDVFAQMTAGELDHYAKTGTLPPRFAQVMGATGAHGPGDNGEA